MTSTGDQAEAAPGDENCTTTSEGCTLRAAIEEGDASGKSTKILFQEPTFDGQSAATIVLGGSLPPVTVQTFINGRTCQTEAGLSGPCVGIEGHAGEPALTVHGGSKVEIWGLAITGAQTAVSVSESPSFKAQASWFGIGLDGDPGANGTGILIGPGSDKSQVGSEGAERRNVIAASSADGLDVHGASEVKILGNYFGVEPDGIGSAANGGDDIEVVATGGKAAAGTVIGANVGSSGAATAACDEGCNVISNAGGNGIDLEGDGGGETPAVTTTILGNYIGPDATGAAVLANAATDVRVGKAAQTVIGGHQLGEGNRFNGGTIAVSAGPEAASLVIQGNAIGVGANGSTTLAPPEDGIAVDSGALASAAVEARIVDNQMRMQGGSAIVQRGVGATVADNEIAGAETGIQTLGSTGKRGNLIEGNAIEAASAAGILIENNLNEIVGNSVDGAGTGISIVGAGTFGVKENVVGGNAAADENVIDDSNGDAIRITNPKKANNAIARNRGDSNGGLFIDLLLASPGTETGWPNNAIAPPTLAVVSQLGVSGSAEPGATVRVFRKQSGAAGELQSFLGAAVADGEGSWSLAYGEPLPADTIVAATQTSKVGGTSELAIATPADEAAVEGGGSPGGASAVGGNPSEPSVVEPVDAIQPETRIAGAPRVRSASGFARFVFFSNEPGASFQCRLDREAWQRCRSPQAFRGLSPGRHVFEVRAVDATGNVDRSPAKVHFVIHEQPQRHSRRNVRR